MKIYIDLLKEIYFYFVNRNKSISDFSKVIFHSNTNDIAVAEQFFSRHMSCKYKYMEVDCYQNSIVNQEDFWNKASFTFEIEELSDSFFLCYDNCSPREDGIFLQKETHEIIFLGKHYQFSLSKNFPVFIGSICRKDNSFCELVMSWFPELDILSLGENDNIPFFNSFYQKIEEYEEPICFDLINQNDFLPLINKESFFCRSKFALKFPPRFIIVSGEKYYEIGGGLGNEDVGGTEGGIVVHSETGNIFYYEYPLFGKKLHKGSFTKIADSIGEFVQLLQKNNAVFVSVSFSKRFEQHS